MAPPPLAEIPVREGIRCEERLAAAVLTRATSKINLTPMLDVVFIMLIFFIVTATFVKEVGLDLNSPDEGQAQVG